MPAVKAIFGSFISRTKEAINTRNVYALLTDKKVQARYVDAGAEFGNAISYLPAVGECVGYERLFSNWAFWEREYARRGYRTVSFDDFVDLGGYGKSIDELLGIKREVNEEPTLHSEIYRKHFLHKEIPAQIEWQEGNAFGGTYILPSTGIIAARKGNPVE